MTRLLIVFASLLAVGLISITGVSAEALSLNPISAATQMNFLWRLQVPKTGGIDYMTSTDPEERDLYASDGAIFYVPATNVPGNNPLYRLWNIAIPDHKDSMSPEGGYQTELISGYPWPNTTRRAGVSQISRVRNPSTGDWALTKPGESLSGYTEVQALDARGYARYNNSDDDDVLLSISAGGVQVDSSRSAGGCVWQWSYRGMPYIEHYDYGREMQSVFFFTDSNNIYRNPTECGGPYSTREDPPQTRHGSPMVVGYNSGSTQVTRAIPTEWYLANFGGDRDHPVLDTDLQIGKDLQLNFNNMGPVAKYTTQVYTPVDINLNQQNALYIPTAYVFPHSPSTDYYTVDAATNVMTQTTLLCNGGQLGYRPDSGYGGVIVSLSPGNHAMGFFGVGQNVGGPVDTFKLVNDQCLADTAEFSILSAAYKRLIAKGWSSYTTWVMSGTVTEVRQYMRQLYCFNTGACTEAREDKEIR